MELKFFICNHCGNIIAFTNNKGVPVSCCGEPMKELVPNTEDASQEKHVPVVEREERRIKVKIGSVEHPMVDAHFIEWVCLQTKQGNQRKWLKPGDAPEVCFSICKDDEPIAVLAYCNLHGLWKAEVK
ncbi:MAG: desulfoferrodoxin [Firmicutes bacterium]|nr:desulfoferrodoxin [Bacillota bacterium]